MPTWTYGEDLVVLKTALQSRWLGWKDITAVYNKLVGEERARNVSNFYSRLGELMDTHPAYASNAVYEVKIAELERRIVVLKELFGSSS